MLPTQAGASPAMSADVLNVFFSPGNLEQFLSSSACPA